MPTPMRALRYQMRVSESASLRSDLDHRGSFLTHEGSEDPTSHWGRPSFLDAEPCDSSCSGAPEELAFSILFSL
eukprot:8447292-Heterocapsa_arctica.AAC.1